jgi:hypothetical protein
MSWDSFVNDVPGPHKAVVQCSAEPGSGGSRAPATPAPRPACGRRLRRRPRPRLPKLDSSTDGELPEVLFPPLNEVVHDAVDVIGDSWIDGRL